MRLTIERAIASGAVPALYEMYTTAFEPIRTRAAARHMLTETEFATEMADERIEKYVVSTDDGEPLALTTLTRDPSAVPWISPEFYTTRYPAHVARGALYYLGYTLVRPGRPAHRVFTTMLGQVVDRLVRERAVCVFDVSAYNDRRAVGRFVSALPRGHEVTVEVIDVQTYYGATFGSTNGCDTEPGAAPVGGTGGAA